MHNRLILFVKALAAGERWITVRPGGPGTEGRPILIKPAADGAYKVIGGAGGSLNHLKLTGVRSEADYKANAKRSTAARRVAKQEQAKKDREAGLAPNKKQARELVQAELGQHQAAFVKTVADAMGWKEDDIRFPAEKFANASEGAVKKAAARHASALLRKAQEAVGQQRTILLNDAAARSHAELGEIPLQTDDPGTLSVQDLSPITPETKGFGYSTDYAKRAQERGLTAAELRDEAAAAKPASPDGVVSPAEARKATGERIAQELKAIAAPAPKVAPSAVIDARKAVELLKAEKALKAVQKQATARRRAIDAAQEPIEPKAYILEVGKPVDHDVVRDLENDLRTIRTRAFLDEVGKIDGGAEAIGRHVGSGAYNSVNALALAATGASLVDRSVVDVLGVAGAAQVLARRLHSDLTPAELDDIRTAMGKFHVDHYMALSDSALREAREWQEAAHEIELGDAATGADLAAAQELNARRREFADKATQVLGTAFGEMEANAALVVALEQPRKDKIDVSLGATSIENAIRQARAIGLDRGDYQVEKIGRSTILTVQGGGLDKLAAPVARADLERTRGALDIIEGRADEDGWLPEGVADRPDLAVNVPAGVAPRLAKPFRGGAKDQRAAIMDYIGGRSADGDSPADIMEGLLSEDTLRASGDRAAFMSALNELVPLYRPDGSLIRAESHQAAFDSMADAFVEKEYGGALAPLHRQKLAVDAVSADALHRALASNPEGTAAFKPIGDLSPQDQGALRGAFLREYGKADPEAEAARTELAKLDAAEPEKEIDDMFGRGLNPAWSDWQARRNDAAERVNKGTMTWNKYLDVMGSPANAYAAMQDVIKSKVIKDFAETHNRLRPDQPLKVGRQVIAHDLDHLDALDPAARERRLAEHRGLVDRLRNRVGGKYAAGGVGDKLDAARASEAAAEQAQMGLFGADDLLGDPSSPQAQERALQLGERHTIGHAAERAIAGMMPIIGKNFRAGQPAQIWRPDMSGAYVGRQRAVKLIEHNGRTMLGLGVGSGKTAISLSAFTHMKSKGKAKRGLFLVPSIVQGEFHSQALTLLKPGAFTWHAQPGATREERIAAYKNPDVDFSVVTHQAFRDDMIHLAAEHDGVSPREISAKIDAMRPDQRAEFLRSVMAHHGIDHDYLAVDEGHNLLNRAGKEDSRLASVVDAVSRDMPTYVNMTADPVKNDASEAFDVLAKMDPARYADRAAFLRKYGVDTASAKDGLRREMARYFYTGRIDPGVKAHERQVAVQLSPEQHQELAALDDAAAKAKIASTRGGVDIEAMQRLSPGSFAGVDPALHGDVAARLQKSVGIMHASAVHHALNGGAKTEALAKIAADRRGAPGVVFVHRLDRVKEIEARLKADGHKVVSLTGADSSAAKDKIKRQFQAGDADIIVCSDAGAVGANLQRGQWLAQYDTPMTAKDHAQRNGRIHRIGQKNDVELLDLVADHPAERRARKRLAEKYDLRRIMTSPLDGLDDSGIAGALNRVRSGEAEAAQPHAMPVPDAELPELEPEAQGSLF